MTNYEPQPEDAQHIQRLQELQQLGTHNMFTELRSGLVELFGSDGADTYEWVVDHFDYFESGEWTEVDTEELRDA